MSEHIKEKAAVKSSKAIGTDIYDLVLEAKGIAGKAVAGQFVSVYCNDGARLLPRPISLCGVDKEAGTLRLVYRIAGKGTEEFSRLAVDDTVEVMGPLGNGFPLSDKPAILMGGGIGIPPMVELAKELKEAGCKDITAVLGYRDELFLVEDMKQYAKVVIATEDGSTGTKGNVIDAVKEQNVTGEIIYSCGPTPMLRAIKAYGAEKGLTTYLSLEERMACGIGACLACVCKSKEVDHHSHVNNKRVCKEGPVFLAEEVEI